MKYDRNLDILILKDSDIPQNIRIDECFENHSTFTLNVNNNKYKNFYVQCKSCDSLGLCQGSGYICNCKFNVYEIYNLCQCVSCNEITPFITSDKNEKISMCHPIININGVKNLKKIKKR
jgi:hypothetical protein